MKNFSLILFSILLFACGKPSVDYDAQAKLDAVQQQELLRSVIRYMGKLPGKGNLQTRHEPQFDDHYNGQVDKHRLDLYHQDPATGDVYFMASRIAPSVHVKRVGVGVHLRKTGDEITQYEEVFRTWKMTEEELAVKGLLLFEKMVKGEDLTPYYPENSGKEEYIEFPDQHTTFDVEKRTWVSSLEDPLTPYYELKAGGRDSL